MSAELEASIAKQSAAPAEVETTPDDGSASERSRRRRKLLLLALLSIIAVGLLSFSAWYLLFRKPISEFPLPPIGGEPMPGYSYSLYGPIHPTGIAVTADGSRIYVTQTDADPAVLVLDRDGKEIGRMLPPATATDHVFVYVAIDPLTGDVYVSDRPAGVIYVYSAEGAFMHPFEVPASLGGWEPLGLAFTTNGHLFVTDPNMNVVHEFDAQSALVRTIGAAGQFSFPNSAVADASGRIYVADSNNGRLIVLDQSGAQVAAVRRGPADGDLGLPRGMALDDEQRLYVVDAVDQSVKVYRPAADQAAAPLFIGRFGTEGAGDGAFRFPNAVATDTRGRVYVADWDNDRVQVWTY